MTLGKISGRHHFPPFGRWPHVDDARTIERHALAYTAYPAYPACLAYREYCAYRASNPHARRQPGAPFLPCSRGEHAGTY